MHRLIFKKCIFNYILLTYFKLTIHDYVLLLYQIFKQFLLWFETSLFHRSLHHPLHLPFLLYSMVQFQKPRMYKDEALHLFPAKKTHFVIALSREDGEKIESILQKYLYSDF